MQGARSRHKRLSLRGPANGNGPTRYLCSPVGPRCLPPLREGSKKYDPSACPNPTQPGFPFFALFPPPRFPWTVRAMCWVDFENRTRLGLFTPARFSGTELFIICFFCVISASTPLLHFLLYVFLVWLIRLVCSFKIGEGSGVFETLFTQSGLVR